MAGLGRTFLDQLPPLRSKLLALALQNAMAFLLVAASTQASVAQGMSLPGKFAVSSSGAATYTIPISAPPGTSGMSPSLSLDYNSFGGNGVVGVGWMLSGIPAVGRCPRTIAQDGIKGAVNYDADDRFCLDGQRLVAISGAYGADGTEYRTEIEGFSRVVSHGVAGNGPAWFEIRAKSGQIIELGNTADSKIFATGQATVRSWSANKVSDTKGNYYTVTYAQDAANGQAYPSRIDYTGNAGAGVPPYNSVRFVYGSRTDITPMYQGGSVVRTTQRLTEIQTYSGANQVADYQLMYEQSASTQNSRLTSIALCGANGSCLPATTFSWLTGGSAFVHAGNLGTGFGDNVPVHDERYFPMDVNGDGRRDFVARDSNGVLSVYLSNGTTFTFAGSTSTGWGDNVPVADQRYFVMDVNGDGKEDLVVRSTDGYFWMYVSNGSTLTSAGNANTGFGDNVPIHDKRFFIMDVNGDGKKDIVIRTTAGSLKVYLSQGSSFSYAGATSTGYGDNIAVNNTRYFVMDVNGDGKDDFVIRTTNGYFSVFVSNGATFTGAGSLATGFGDNVPVHDQRFFVMDINGDGNQDVVARDSSGNFSTFLSTVSPTLGYTFTVGGVTSTAWGDNIPVADTRYFVMDVNGDGKQDVVVRSSDGYLVTYLSDGRALVYASSVSIGFGDNVPIHDQRYFIVDVNGDGRQDFVARDSDSNGYLHVYLSNGAGFSASGTPTATGLGDNVPVNNPRYFVMELNKQSLVMRDSNGALKVYGALGPSDVLSSVATGLGVTTAVTYKPLTDSSVYTKDATAVYPTVDIQSPSLYVVSRVDASNGIGGNYGTSYAYAGAKIGTNGRGFLGFRQAKTADLQTNAVQTSNYRQDFPYIGMLVSATKTFGTVTLSQSTSTPQFLNAAGSATLSTTTVTAAPYRVSVAQTVTSGNDLDGTALPSTTSTFQYDAYGNTTQVAVSSSDGHSKTTSNSYTNDTVNWFLGRLTTSSVTAQAP